MDDHRNRENRKGRMGKTEPNLTLNYRYPLGAPKTIKLIGTCSD